jgi:hypothetical protein
MSLLVDFLDTASSYISERREKLKKLESKYRNIYDPDIMREMKSLRSEIARKRSDVRNELFFNLEEFRALEKYFPELLKAFMEDEYIGKTLTDKAWLLAFRPLPAAQAAAKLQELRDLRGQLRDAKKSIRGYGTVNTMRLVTNYPILAGQVQGQMDKKDIIAVIDKLDSLIKKEGWLTLLSDSLIKIPLTKYMNKILALRYEELTAKADSLKLRGKGTVAEAKVLRTVQELTPKRERYERMMTHMLLANPSYLNSIRNKKAWTSREKADAIEKFAKAITPHRIKERAWLNEMNKRIGKG